MSLDTLVLLAFWAALVALAYIGWVDVLIPDLLTGPATLLGLMLSFVANPRSLVPTIGAIALGYFIPLGVYHALLAITRTEWLGQGVMKGCAMLGAYLGITHTLIALALLLAGVPLLVTVLKTRSISLAIPIAVAGFVASLMRWAGWP